MYYDYACTSCLAEWEEEQSIKDEPIKICKFCKEETAKRLISKTSFILHGRGWAADGYKK